MINSFDISDNHSSLSSGKQPVVPDPVYLTFAQKLALFRAADSVESHAFEPEALRQIETAIPRDEVALEDMD